MDLFNIKGKKMIVTGGSRGLGKGICEGLLDAGAEIAVIGSSGKVYETVEEFCKKGGRAYAVQGDLGDRGELKESFQKALKVLGGEVHVLFNVAGIQRRHKSEEFPVEDWEEVLNVNLTSTFLMCQLAAREMIARGNGGKIINIASMLSFFGGYTVPAYAASKGGVAQLTKALCNEWAGYGINVNAIAPGYMDTDMNTKLKEDAVRNTEILGRIPAGRWGTPKDMQGLAVFLASEASDYVNGAVIPCDGGYLVR